MKTYVLTTIITLDFEYLKIKCTKNYLKQK